MVTAGTLTGDVFALSARAAREGGHLRRRRTSVTSIVAGLNQYFHDAGRSSPHGPLTNRAVPACATADTLHAGITTTSTGLARTGTRARTPCAGRRRAVTPAGQPQFAGVRSGLAQSKWSGRTRSEVRRVSERLFSGRSACKPRRAWTAERTPRWPRSRPRTATTASGTTGLTDSSTGSGTSPRRAGARVQPCRVVHSVGARSHRTPRG